MLEKYLNKKIEVDYTNYAYPVGLKVKGVITEIDDNFIELDNEMIIAIRYIISIEEI